MIELSQFTPPHPLNTAVLFLVFNRLDTTKQVFEAIRQAKPPRLYVAADGARASKEGEADKAQAVRDYIMQNIDWECDVKTLFRDQNLGCKYAVSGGINWFFKHEEKGIILEDDCLPNFSFFKFCEKMLLKYDRNKNIMHINGLNWQNVSETDASSYFFSKYPGIWGWATWKDRWDLYNINMPGLDYYIDNNRIYEITSNKVERFYHIMTFKRARYIDTWDHQWKYCVFKHNGLCVIPNKNLIKNIGIGEEATHTRSTKQELLTSVQKELHFPLSHPENIITDELADRKTAHKKFINFRIIIKYLLHRLSLKKAH